MRALLAEPLVPFLVCGVLLWGVSQSRHQDRLHVSPELLGALARDWESAHGSAPDAAQLMATADAWIADELRYREGIALGLDRGDPVVRRRVIQKVQALDAGLEPIPEPSETELRSWLEAHPERYPPRTSVTFEHVYGREDADLAARLTAGASAAEVGAAFPHQFEGPIPLERVERELGPRVAEALAAAPLGEWIAVEAGGWHALRLTARPSPRAPTVDDLRAALSRDWTDARAAERDARADAARREQVEIVWPH